MDAHKLWMLRDFIGTNKVLFRIPVYQRNYDWSEANCDRLLDDIYEIINSGDKHFLGTIVFMAAKSGGFTLQEYTIIDGQQRLTTMMLILKALAVVAETGGDTWTASTVEPICFPRGGNTGFPRMWPLASAEYRPIITLLNVRPMFA